MAHSRAAAFGSKLRGLPRRHGRYGLHAGQKRQPKRVANERPLRHCAPRYTRSLREASPALRDARRVVRCGARTGGFGERRTPGRPAGRGGRGWNLLPADAWVYASAHGRPPLHGRAGAGPPRPRRHAPLPARPRRIARDVVDGRGAGGDRGCVASRRAMRPLPGAQGGTLAERGRGTARRGAHPPRARRRHRAPHPERPGAALARLVRSGDRGGPRRRPLRRAGRRDHPGGRVSTTSPARSGSRPCRCRRPARARRRAGVRPGPRPKAPGCR